MKKDIVRRYKYDGLNANGFTMKQLKERKEAIKHIEGTYNSTLKINIKEEARNFKQKIQKDYS